MTSNTREVGGRLQYPQWSCPHCNAIVGKNAKKPHLVQRHGWTIERRKYITVVRKPLLATKQEDK